MQGIDWVNIIYFALITGVPRTLFMFTLLPMFSSSLISHNVHRNAIVFSVMLFMVPNFMYQLEQDLPIQLDGYLLLSLLLKEVFIGFVMGFLLSLPFMAIQGVGFLFDNQRGASMDSIMNPASESETTSIGNLFNLFFIAYFFVSGMFLQMLAMYYYSFTLWPIFEFCPTIDSKLVTFALGALDYVLNVAVALGGPVLMVMFISEFCLALTNKFAQQLNVFILSMPIKCAIGFFILTIYVTLLSDYFDQELFKLADMYAQLEWLFN